MVIHLGRKWKTTLNKQKPPSLATLNLMPWSLKIGQNFPQKGKDGLPTTFFFRSELLLLGSVLLGLLTHRIHGTARWAPSAVITPVTHLSGHLTGVITPFETSRSPPRSTFTYYFTYKKSTFQAFFHVRPMDPKMGHGRHKSKPQGPQGGRIIQLDAGPTCRTTIQPFYGFIWIHIGYWYYWIIYG